MALNLNNMRDKSIINITLAQEVDPETLGNSILILAGMLLARNRRMFDAVLETMTTNRNNWFTK